MNDIKTHKRTLIVQGGGFRTGFCAGILNAFIISNYRNFDFFICNSDGTIALSYYLSNQYKKYYTAMCLLAADPVKKCFEKNHEVYNKSVDFINNPPADLKIKQISPITLLKTGAYTNSIDAITSDYRNGLDRGLEFIRNGN